MGRIGYNVFEMELVIGIQIEELSEGLYLNVLIMSNACSPKELLSEFFHAAFSNRLTCAVSTFDAS